MININVKVAQLQIAQLVIQIMVKHVQPALKPTVFIIYLMENVLNVLIQMPNLVIQMECL